MKNVGARIRIDKWLWHARITKTRTLAAKLVETGRVRVNHRKIVKPAQDVGPGDVITVAIHDNVRVLKVLAPGLRRGPASEASQLFEEIEAPQPSHAAPQN
ncbi:MAG: RNA-binding S4 domain-containing protein [Rhizobiales bacterium]|nr:RNA-binding S4 domain-containing protein [Hyphomicrobiales bacterium]